MGYTRANDGSLRSCGDCGTPLPEDAPRGICPTCLLTAGFDTISANDLISPGANLVPAGGLSGIVREFGDYTLEREIARGGMGVIYLATQRSLKRRVALKMLLAGPLASSSTVHRFHSEAEAAAKLRHPGIVVIHEVGEYAGLQYFSMDYIEGRNLAEFLRRQPVSSEQAARLLRQLAEAVHYAHLQGVLHRDLKPSNVLIDAAGQPFITDFGLARQIDRESELTASDSVLGTPNYMPPEQASASRGAVGPASDVYSLGAILYEVLTGRPPFRGANVLETLRQLQETDPVPPRWLNSQVPADLETVCLKCLEKDPARRYSSAEALAADLRRYLSHEPVQARPLNSFERVGRWAKRNPGVAALSATVLLLVAAGLMGMFAAYARIASANRIAETRRRQAEQSNTSNQERLALSCVANGMRILDAGDSFGSLPWLVEALAVDPPNPHRERMHRMRLQAVLAPSPRLLQVLPHGGEVHHVDFSPDGRYLLTSCYDRAARLWDVATGELAAPPMTHQGQINIACFSPDGSLVLTASDDHTARIWDANTGLPRTMPLPHLDRVLHASFAPDGRRVVTASSDHTARIWDAATGTSLTPPMQHPAPVRRARFSPDGRLLVTGSFDGMARTWETATGNSAGPALRHTEVVLDVSFSPDGRLIATTSADGTARVWDVATGRPITRPLRHERAVGTAVFSPDGRRLATASDDGAARTWDVEAGDLLLPPLRHGAECLHVTFSSDGKRILTASNDQSARVWDALSGEALTPPLKHTGWIRQSAFSADGTLVATASGDRTAKIWAVAPSANSQRILSQEGAVVRARFSHNGRWVAAAGYGTNGSGVACLWDSSTARQLSTPIRHRGPVNTLEFSLDDSLLLTASEDRTVRLWDRQSGKLVGEPIEHAYPVQQAGFSPDGQLILTVSGPWQKPGQVRLWWRETRDLACPPLVCSNALRKACFSPDGSLVLTASGTYYGEGDQGEAQLWDAASGRAVGPALRHGREVRDAAFSPDGRRVVTVSSDQTACIWDVRSGARLAGPIRHGGWVAGVVFDGGGQRFLTICDDQTARVWSTATGEGLTPPLKHAHLLHRGVFDPGDELIATASADRTARVWDAITGQPITPSLPHGGEVGDVSFSPDGRRLLTASGDGTARLYDLPVCTMPLADLKLAAQLLSARRLDPAGGSIPLESVFLRETLRDLRGRYPELFGRP